MSAAPDAPPPFKLTRESRIRIDRDGYLWHEGERILHRGLSDGLARWVTIDPATDRYILRNTLDWCFITVDDAPLAVRSVSFPTPDAVPILALSDGTSEPLDPATLRIDADDVPYCTVRGGALPARFSRQAAFALLERSAGETHPDALVLGGKTWPLRRVARGEGAPHREPAHPEDA